MVTPVVKRQAVAHLCQAYEVSQRRACQVISADRTSMRYSSVRPDDADLRARLRELAAIRCRFGYRRRDCQYFCVRPVIRHEFTNRSLNMTAN